VSVLLESRRQSAVGRRQMVEVGGLVHETKKERTRRYVIQAWLKRSLLDYFVAFITEELVNYRLFPLHQAIEKMCKAYLLGVHADKYAGLDSQEMTRWIEKFVRQRGHDLWVLMKEVSESFPDMKEWVMGDRSVSFLDLLTMAYEEARYPKPIGESIWDRHGYPALASTRNEEQAFIVGAILLQTIQGEYRIPYPLTTNPIDHGIHPDDWQRFLNIWNLRTDRMK